MDIVEYTKQQYKMFGQSKSMDNTDGPCFFLQRNFKGEQDLLIIFNTKGCRFNCKYCGLSNKNIEYSTPLIEQFAYVIGEIRHTLSVLDRITLSNNGSILDFDSVCKDELLYILNSIAQIKNISSVVIETDLRFVNETVLYEIKNILPNIRLNILTGFETLDNRILTEVLGKYRQQVEFENKLSILSMYGCELTAYILYKPDQFMNDEMAYNEALKSINYLDKVCKERNLPLVIRINPMFAAKGTRWAEIAKNTEQYSPPKISDIYRLSMEVQKRIPVYIGLSLEEKNEIWGSYRIHKDATKELLLEIIKFNTCHEKR